MAAWYSSLAFISSRANHAGRQPTLIHEEIDDADVEPAALALVVGVDEADDVKARFTRLEVILAGCSLFLSKNNV